MSQLSKTILTTTTTISSIGSIYYFIPGFPHLFASDSMRISLAFALLIIFIIAFFTAVQLTSAKSDVCQKCGWNLKTEKGRD